MMKSDSENSIRRREFLRGAALVSGGILFAPELLAGNAGAQTRLTILHTNDTHSNIDPFPENHAKHPGMGGVARRHAMIQKIRGEEEHVLLLDAGDIFQGTPYFNRYGGSLEMRLMSELGYDAATMGNHDFDAGTEGFVKARQLANFPFLCANYDFSNTPIDGQTQAHAVFRKGKLRIGIFGLGVALKGLVPDTKFGETRYLDPIEIAQDQCRYLKEKDCDLIICLSHLGYEYADERISDRVLAAATRDIHLILGGHTHTFLEKPEIIRNLDGDPVLINQVGWGGVHLGRVDFEFERGLHSPGPLIVD